MCDRTKEPSLLYHDPTYLYLYILGLFLLLSFFLLSLLFCGTFILVVCAVTHRMRFFSPKKGGIVYGKYYRRRKAEIP